MGRLSGLDAGFLYFETPTMLLHTLKLVLLDRLAESADVRQSLIAATRNRLHSLPQLRHRLLEVPFGLHHPLWIDSMELDLERHVLVARIEAPGGDLEMDAAVAKIAGCPLERTRPLWELWVLEGRRDGAVAVLLKIHHALADGNAAAHLIGAVTSHLATAPPSVASPPHWEPERVPSKLEVLLDAASDHFHDMASLPALIRRTTTNVTAWIRQEHLPKPPRPMLDAPRTSFNGALTQGRSLATLSLSLTRALAVKSAAQVTLNDVVLSMVGSALRAYLIERDELPQRSLIASVPISSDPEGSERLMGNRVSSLFTTLATDLVDPWERLRLIHSVTQQAKRSVALLGSGLMGDWLQYVRSRPLSWVVAQWSRWGIANLVPPPVNVVVSNVHGPSVELFADGLPLRAIYSVGPILEGIGLNITVWSYLDKLHFSVLGCPDMMPQPFRIARLLEVALDDLELCADDASGRTRKHQPSSGRLEAPTQSEGDASD